ncbi:hypothetical protein HYQ45_018474 [Verticillium longisporum]|uniref:Uncharacterized protein n=1 Tax=Verticillium longisporum TaxID=100787 RepID=A0A8I2Z2B9_VERLO|nr:hypothetical protein HYQ45_018474 [Verticillium longisporum]
MYRAPEVIIEASVGRTGTFRRGKLRYRGEKRRDEARAQYQVTFLRHIEYFKGIVFLTTNVNPAHTRNAR